MIYLVKAKVRISRYMEDRPEPFEEVFRLVEARSYGDAEIKFRKHYEEKGSEYSHSYYVDIEDVSSIIT